MGQGVEPALQPSKAAKIAIALVGIPVQICLAGPGKGQVQGTDNQQHPDAEGIQIQVFVPIWGIYIKIRQQHQDKAKHRCSRQAVQPVQDILVQHIGCRNHAEDYRQSQYDIYKITYTPIHLITPSAFS